MANVRQWRSQYVAGLIENECKPDLRRSTGVGLKFQTGLVFPMLRARQTKSMIKTPRRFLHLLVSINFELGFRTWH